MLISKTTLIELIDTPLDKSQVLDRLHRYYCRPMTRSGHCTTNCLDCKGHLSDIFERLKNSTDARDPFALLVWHLRNKVAQIQEQKEEPVLRTDWLGQPLTDNPFLALLKEL